MKNRIGIVGGGQLGRMFTLAAKSMGFAVTAIDPTPHSPAGQVADEQIIADYSDENAIKKLAAKSDYITFEVELANAKLLDELSSNGARVNPSAKTLTIIKDKLAQKKFLRNAGLPVADFVEIKSELISGERSDSRTKLDSGVARILREDIKKAIGKFGYPVLLKARFDAYDGRGNYLIKNEEDIEKGLEKLKNRKLYVEKFVQFVKELAVVTARNHQGEIAQYPVVETIHRNNICHLVFAPAEIDKKIADKAVKIAHKTMKVLHGAGVFAIEMFLSKDGEIVINEIAPRVHNSGHFSIEACVTSQFEQHIRAVTGLPLGSTEMKVPAAVMINILGERKGEADLRGLDKALSLQNVSVHIYGKAETRVERKMGHITVVGESLEEALVKAKKARSFISI